MARTAVETEHEDTGRTAVLERMTDILEQLQKNAPPNEPGFADPRYQARLREEGYFDEFPVDVFQNGKKAEPRGLTAETRELVGKLKPGLWLQGAVSVQVDQHGKVHLGYKTAGKGDRMNFYAKYPDFDTLIAKLWAEMYPTVS